jgi:hypothetical protein
MSVTLTIPETMDANPPPSDGAETPHLNPRAKIMEEIAAKRARAMDEENARAAIYDREATEAGLNWERDEPEQEPEPGPVREQPRESARVHVEPPPPAPVAPPAVVAPPMVRTIRGMDGNFYQVTQEQADSLAALGMMANVALHQTPQSQHQPAPEPVPEIRPIVDPDTIREAVKKIQYGGEDDAAQALTDLLIGTVTRAQAALPKAPVIDQDAIVSRAVQESRAQSQLVADQQIIRQEYGDIFENPQRTLLAKWNVDALRQRDMAMGIRRPDLDIYREAGEMVRQAMGAPAAQMEAPPDARGQAPTRADRSDIIERKRLAPRPTSTVDMRAPAPAQPRAPSGSEIVARMRAARFQPN